MKQVLLKNITKPDKSSVYVKRKAYCLALDWNLTYYFTDLKDAKKCLAEVNRFLNNKLFEINEAFISVYSSYRRIWFYLDATRDLQRDIEDNIKLIDVLFDRTITSTAGPSGNFIAFGNLKKITKTLIKILETINIVHKKRCNYAEIRTIVATIKYIQTIENEIKQSDFEVSFDPKIKCYKVAENPNNINKDKKNA